MSDIPSRPRAQLVPALSSLRVESEGVVSAALDVGVGDGVGIDVAFAAKSVNTN